MFWTLRKKSCEELEPSRFAQWGSECGKVDQKFNNWSRKHLQSGEDGHQGPSFTVTSVPGWTFIKRATVQRTLDKYIWHLFRFWHILSSYYNTLYILLFSAGTSYGIHIFMYAVKCILTCVRYPIYISIPCISLLSYSSYLSTLCSNIKVFTCHNI